MLSKISRLLKAGGTELENKKNSNELIAYIKQKIEYLALLNHADAEQSKLIKEAHLATLNHMLATGATRYDLYGFATSLLKLSQEEYTIAINAYNEKQIEHSAAMEKLSKDIGESLAKWKNVKFDFGQSESKEESESLSRKSSDSNFIDFDFGDDQFAENKTESIGNLDDFDFSFGEDNNVTTQQTDNQNCATVHTNIKKSFHHQYTKESQYSGFFTRVEGEEKTVEPVYLEDAELKDYRGVQNGF